MSIFNRVWYIYIDEAQVGRLEPFDRDGEWICATLYITDRWENFAPWFEGAADAHYIDDEVRWNNIYSQLIAMGLHLVAEDGERYDNPTIVVDGDRAWFTV